MNRSVLVLASILALGVPAITDLVTRESDAVAMPTDSAQSKPGWQPWQLITKSESLPFDSGFSNMELGGYLEYEHACKQAASSAKITPTYWYRLSDEVWEIGTGEVKFGCQIEKAFVATHLSTAIRKGLDHPVCLRVQSDVGSGVRVREKPTLESRSVGFLGNGTEIYQKSLPALITTDATGRRWLALGQGGNNGWASLAAKKGDHLNFKLCPPDI
ncbi:MAG: hypothetical protein F6K10_18150 [Moorea sp. SIO2B7]|nr:hypothetical protein [Moorena sp. SIO2B7]